MDPPSLYSICWCLLFPHIHVIMRWLAMAKVLLYAPVCIMPLTFPVPFLRLPAVYHFFKTGFGRGDHNSFVPFILTASSLYMDQAYQSPGRAGIAGPNAPICQTLHCETNPICSWYCASDCRLLQTCSALPVHYRAG